MKLKQSFLIFSGTAILPTLALLAQETTGTPSATPAQENASEKSDDAASAETTAKSGASRKTDLGNAFARNRGA